MAKFRSISAKLKLALAGGVALLVVLVLVFGSSSPTQPGSQTPLTTTSNTSSSSSATSGSSQVPTFGAGGGSGAGGKKKAGGGGGAGGKNKTGRVSGGSGAALAQKQTQGVDVPHANPLEAFQSQFEASHLLLQRVPLTKSGVTLSLGAFGDSQKPGIQVNFSGSLAHARKVVAQVFAQYHDHERGYLIRYSGSFGG
jgi:hypothetical protein